MFSVKLSLYCVLTLTVLFGDLSVEGSSTCTPCGASTWASEGYAQCAPCNNTALCATGSNNKVCSDHGVCMYGRCLCSAGWAGALCSDGTPGAGFVQFKDDYAFVNEKSGTVKLAIERSNGLTGIASVTVTFKHTAQLDGIADGGTIVVNLGDGVASTTVDVTITDDVVRGEPCGVVTAAITKVTGGSAVGARNESLLLVEDDDFNTLELQKTAAVGGELVSPSLYKVLIDTPTTHTFPVKVTVPSAAGRMALDLVLLQDLSGSYGDDLVAMRLILPNLVSTMQEQFPDPWFGVR